MVDGKISQSTMTTELSLWTGSYTYVPVMKGERGDSKSREDNQCHFVSVKRIDGRSSQ